MGLPPRGRGILFLGRVVCVDFGGLTAWVRLIGPERPASSFLRLIDVTLGETFYFVFFWVSCFTYLFTLNHETNDVLLTSTRSIYFPCTWQLSCL